MVSFAEGLGDRAGDGCLVYGYLSLVSFQHSGFVGAGTYLCRVHGNDDGGHANANAADDPGDIEGCQGVRVERLDDGANVEDGRGEHQGPAAAEPSGEWPDEEAGEEGCIMRVSCVALAAQDKKPLKDLANPTRIGDPVSLRAETSNTEPTDQDRGAKGNGNKSLKQIAEEKNKTNPSQLGVFFSMPFSAWNWKANNNR